MNMNIISLRKDFLSQAMATVTVVALLSSVVAPLSAFAKPTPPPPASVTIDLINGQPQSGFCIAGAITIVGLGVTGSQGGPYEVDFGWGDGATTTINNSSPEKTSGLLDGASEAFGFTVSHTPIGPSNGLTIFLHHSQPSGQDTALIVVNQCVAPPTQGVVVVKKHVVNDNGGSATASAFTLHINGNNFSGSETGTLPGFTLNPGSYPITENAVSGYTQTGFSCTDNNVATSTTNSTINVSAGHNYVCTVTNDDAAPTLGGLIVQKILNNTGGGTAAASSFSFKINGGSDVPFNTDGINSFTLGTGAYSVTENSAAHYTSGLVGCTGTIITGATSTCTVTNTFFNNAPMVQNISIVTDEDIASSTVLVGSDIDLDAILYALVTSPNPLSGLLSGFNSSTGAITFTPTPNFNGSDSFTYQASDAYSSSNTGTVSITVNPVNDAPVANDDAYSTNEDIPVTTGNVLTNDTDVDLDTLFVSAADATSVQGGTVVNNNDGTFTYTPSTNYNGSDSFNYTVSDGSLTDTGTVTIIVSSTNDAPVAVPDVYSTAEDTLLTVPATGVLTNDTDVDLDTLTAILDTTTTNGTLALVSDGSFTYTPNADFNGIDSFTYHANDGAANSGTITATITVTSVNDAPVSTGQTLSTPQNVAVAGVLGATDVDGDNLTYVTTSNPTNGTITFFNSVTGAFTYVPNSNYVGPDSFDFNATDGSLTSNTSTVSITVSSSPEDTLPLCTDRKDNDNDDLTDLADPDCAAFIPKLTVTKIVINDNGGTLGVSDFPLFVDETLVTSGATTTVTVGTHIVSETSTSTYAATIGGDCDSEGSITLAAGDEKSCTITNNDIEIITPPADVCPNLEGSQPTVPNGYHLSDGQCIVDTTPPAPVTDICSNLDGTQELVPAGFRLIGNQCVRIIGGNGPLGGGTPAPAGVVLGASTSTDGSVLGVSAEMCSQYLTSYVRFGGVNNSEQVLRLQRFLRDLEGFSGVSETGVYDNVSLAAVHAFQLRNAGDILAPWGATRSTGYVYYTTRKKINEAYCKFTRDFPLTDDQLGEINRVRSIGEAASVKIPITPSVSEPAQVLPKDAEQTQEVGSGNQELQPAAVNASLPQGGQSGGFLKRLWSKIFGN